MSEILLNNDHRSKIVSLKITNFMSIKDAFIEFDESNIISLCGYNDSGKSAVTRLMEIMLYDAYPQEQVKFITDDEEYFEGVLTFDDGVVYTRAKFSDGRSFWELSKNGTVIYTNKLKNGTYAALDGNPEPIEAYLGVVRDEQTGEKLNVRRNSDKLFLIATSGGDNYKILNSVLKSEVLAKATKSLTEDRNKLQKDINEKETKRSAISEQYEKIDVAPQDEIDLLKSYISRLNETKGKCLLLSNIMDSAIRYNSISVYDELIPVDSERLKSLERIMELCAEKSIPVYPKLDSVDVDRLKSLETIMNLQKEKAVPIYSELKPIDCARLTALRNIMLLRQNIKGNVYEELKPINVSRVKDIEELGGLYTKYYTISKKLAETVETLKQKKAELAEMSAQYGFKVCKNCGSIVE